MTAANLTNRRTIIAAGGALATLAAAPVMARKSAAPAPVMPPEPAALPMTAQPLPFDAASLGWLSEKLITSHHDNNYVGAVKRLDVIRTQFAGLDIAAAPTFTVNGLKREELIAWNSMILHELYFAGLSGGVAVSAPLAAAIERDFGSMGRWQAEFTAMGKALGGGSGWVVLTWSHRERKLNNQWAADHSMSHAGATPILVLDMYEHAYAMDFGAKAAAYVDGFMKNVSWGNANATFSRQMV
ncbi:MAG: Fe-Mn family superoxide dismutase [Novosphingobium sp.]